MGAAGCGGNATTGTKTAPGEVGALSGSWEIVGSGPSRVQESVLVTVSPTVLTINARGGSVSAAAQGDAFDVSVQWGAHQQSFTAVRTPAQGGGGIIPLPLFGTWTANTPGSTGCDIQAGTESVSATCANVSLPGWAPRINGHLTATKTAGLESEYGDLSGQWSITTDTSATCTLRFEANTASLECRNAPYANGTASVTIDGDTAHGSTSTGIEFTAQRR
jgi:hypothetical protein